MDRKRRPAPLRFAAALARPVRPRRPAPFFRIAMTTALDQLKQYTTVVADTGDFQQFIQFKPQDATTNPSLILKAVQKDDYKPLLEKTVKEHAKQPMPQIIDNLLVAFGTEILKIIPGRVSTEVDARLSFDTKASIAKAHDIIKLYENAGVSVCAGPPLRNVICCPISSMVIVAIFPAGQGPTPLERNSATLFASGNTDR